MNKMKIINIKIILFSFFFIHLRSKPKKLLMKRLLLFLFLPFLSFSQTRYLDDIFTSVTVTSDVQYAENISILPMLTGGQPALMPILCDIYQPTGDNVTNRPVVILAHTGSFLPPVINGQPTGGKTDSSVVQQCMRWARKGYVAVAMSYRLGWNPTSTDQDTRTSTLLQAAYRGIQDAKAMVRFLRKTEDVDGNPYGIDPNKIALGGQGTGGYISLGYATLDTVGDNIPWQEIYLTKFFNLTTMQPYVYPPIFGNYDGTDATFMPIYDTLGNIIGQTPWNIPNWPTYSNEITMAFNIGGCLGDSSWLEQGDVPIVSFHCAKDPSGPYANGDVIVPTTGNFVVEAQGSYIVQKHQDMYGNNAVFSNGCFSDVFTQASVSNNTLFNTINGYPVGNNYNGLYTFITPPPSTTPNAFGESYAEAGAPWDWWDNTWYDAMFAAINGAPPGYGAANSILGNPNMSSAHGNAYLDTIQGYLNPRMMLAFGLNTGTGNPGCMDSTACNYDPSASCDDGSCAYPTTSTTDAAACDTYTWSIDGNTYTTGGTYTYMSINANGCEHTDILNLTMVESVAIFQDGDILHATVNPSGIDYTSEWYNIDIDTEETWLMGEENSFEPVFNCNYFLVVTTDYDCEYTTEVYAFSDLAGQIYDLKISPNPTSDLLNIKYINERNQFVRIYLANSNGVVLDEFISSENEMNIDISNYPSGVYHVYFSSEDHCTSEAQQISRKIILNK